MLYIHHGRVGKGGKMNDNIDIADGRSMMKRKIRSLSSPVQWLHVSSIRYLVTVLAIITSSTWNHLAYTCHAKEISPSDQNEAGASTKITSRNDGVNSASESRATAQTTNISGGIFSTPRIGLIVNRTLMTNRSFTYHIYEDTAIKLNGRLSVQIEDDDAGDDEHIETMNQKMYQCQIISSNCIMDFTLDDSFLIQTNLINVIKNEEFCMIDMIGRTNTEFNEIIGEITSIPKLNFNGVAVIVVKLSEVQMKSEYLHQQRTADPLLIHELNEISRVRLMFRVEPVNDRPQLTVPPALNATHDEWIDVLMKVHDPDAFDSMCHMGSNYVIEFDISAKVGEIKLRSADARLGLHFDVMSASRMQGRGLMSDVQNVFSNKLTYRYTGQTLSVTNDIVFIAINDKGNCGFGDEEVVNATINVQIIPTNKSPTISADPALTHGNFSVLEDTLSALPNIYVFDDGPESDLMLVEVSALIGDILNGSCTQNDSLQISSSLTWREEVSWMGQHGTKTSLKFKATPSVATLILSCLYVNPFSNFHGQEKITVRVEDKAGDQSSAEYSFRVTSVDDPPEIILTNIALRGDGIHFIIPKENTTIVQEAVLNIIDVDDRTSNIDACFDIVVLVVKGNLQIRRFALPDIDLLEGSYVDENSAGQVLRFNGELVDVNKVLSSLLYTKGEGAFDVDEMYVRVSKGSCLGYKKIDKEPNDGIIVSESFLVQSNLTDNGMSQIVTLKLEDGDFFTGLEDAGIILSGIHAQTLSSNEEIKFDIKARNGKVQLGTEAGITFVKDENGMSGKQYGSFKNENRVYVVQVHVPTIFAKDNCRKINESYKNISLLEGHFCIALKHSRNITQQTNYLSLNASSQEVEQALRSLPLGSEATVERESNSTSQSWIIRLNNDEVIKLALANAEIEYVGEEEYFLGPQKPLWFENSTAVNLLCNDKMESPNQLLDWCRSFDKGQQAGSCRLESKHGQSNNQGFIEVFTPRSFYSGIGTVHAVNSALRNMVFRSKKNWNSEVGGYASVEVVLGTKYLSSVSISIDVRPQKDPLEISMPSFPYVIDENKPYSLDSIRLIDHDFTTDTPVSSLYELEIQVHSGTLLLRSKFDDIESSSSRLLKRIGSILSLNVLLNNFIFYSPATDEESLDEKEDNLEVQTSVSGKLSEYILSDMLQVTLQKIGVESNETLKAQQEIYTLPLRSDVKIGLPNGNGFITTKEDTALYIHSIGVVVAGADGHNLSMQLRVSCGAFLHNESEKDRLSGSDSMSILESVGHTFVSVSGSSNDLNEVLEGLLFMPPHDFSGVVEMHISLSYASGDERTSQISINILVTPENDAPLLKVPAQLSVGKGKEIRLFAEIEDVDSGKNDLLTLSITSNFGLFKLKDQISRYYLTKALSGGENGTTFFQVQGTIEMLTHVFGNGHVMYVSREEGETIDWKLEDSLGGISIGKTNVTIRYSPSNELSALELRTGNPVVYIKEDTRWFANITEHWSLVSTRETHESNVFRLEAGAAHGSIVMSRSSGAETTEVSFDGTLQDINSVLRSLSYIPPDDWTGVDLVALTVYDRHLDISATKSIKFVVEPVNDPPELSCDSGCKLISHRSQWTHVPQLHVSDVDSDDFMMAVKIESSEGGLIRLDNWTSFAVHHCSDSPIISLDDTRRETCFRGKRTAIQHMLSKVSYYPPSAMVDSDVILFSVTDIDDWRTSVNSSETVHARIDVHIIETVDQLSWLSDQDLVVNEDNEILVYPKLTGGSLGVGDGIFINISITCTNGSLRHSPLADLVSDEMENKSKIHLEGDVNTISAVLDQGLKYTPNKHMNGFDLISLSASTPVLEVREEISLKINPINDKPVINVDDIVGFVGDDIPLISVEVSDVDENETYGAVSVLAIKASKGTFKVRGKYPGVSVFPTEKEIILQGLCQYINKFLDRGFISILQEEEGFASIDFILTDALSATTSRKQKVIVRPKERAHMSILPESISITDGILDFNQTPALVSVQGKTNSTYTCDVIVDLGFLDNNYRESTVQFVKQEHLSRYLNDFLSSLIYKSPSGFNGTDYVHVYCVDENGDMMDAILSVIVKSPILSPSKMIATHSKFSIMEDTTVNVNEAIGISILNQEHKEIIDKTANISLESTHGSFFLDEARIPFGVSTVFGEKSISLSGPIGDINIVLSQMHFAPPENWVGKGSCFVELYDTDDNVISSSNKSSSLRVHFDVEPVNDNPIVILDTDELVTMEDSFLTLKNIKINDVDSLSIDKLHMTFRVMDEYAQVGGFNINEKELTDVATQRLDYLEGIDAHRHVTLIGTLENLRRGLEKGSIKFFPEQDFNGFGSIEIKLVDNVGGISSTQVRLHIEAVNDPPQIIASSNSLVITEDTPIKLNKQLNITVYDADIKYINPATLPTYSVVIQSFAGGSMRLERNVPGCHVMKSVDNNSNASIFSFQGSLNVINEAMQAIVYTPLPNYDGVDNLNILVNEDL